ncbi:MAG: winged helix DNA-binding domain-containing protein [Candidatus Azobacteroides sp.]|nr:winged helix DNA-binding domain-containing protein [Candidatus Azobacteroides sp.]
MNQIANIRLISHQLSENNFKTPKEIVSWMGAMQAQDYNMAKWGIGIRIPNLTEQSIEDAFNKGEFLRTHVLRPTWHFVAPENIRWMLELTKERIKSSSRSRDQDLEITEGLYTRCNNIIEKALTGNNHLTREELSAVLENAGIVVDTSRMYHFIMRAEVEGIICSGAMQGKKHTYALMEERVPQAIRLDKQEALAKLAGIYFSSHGPATLQDFVWWSGLSAPESRNALEMIKKDLVSETINSQTYWVPDSVSGHSKQNSVYLLPAFDEYIVAYKDRKAVLVSENHSKAISSNGVFRPTIVKNGQVIGIWKKSNKKGEIITADFFEKPDKATLALMAESQQFFNLF